MKNLKKNFIDTSTPIAMNSSPADEIEYPSAVDYQPSYKEGPIEESSMEELEEVETNSEGYEEETTTLKVTPSAETDRVVVDTNTHERLSKLEGTSVRFIDFYKDARTFLEKANSTKFVLVSYVLLSSPVLLMLGFLSEEVYREILIIISLTYLGVDAYEKKSLVRKK